MADTEEPMKEVLLTEDELEILISWLRADGPSYGTAAALLEKLETARLLLSGAQHPDQEKY